MNCTIDQWNHSWFQNNDIEMHSTDNERKPVAAEKFIRNLTKRTYLVNKCNTTYHSTTKIKSSYVKPSTCIDYNKKKWYKEDSKFEFGDHVRILNYKSIFAKGYVPNWSERVFVTKKVKHAVPSTYVISDPNGKEIAGTKLPKQI